MAEGSMFGLPVTGSDMPSAEKQESEVKQDDLSVGPPVGQFSHPVYKQMCLTNGIINRMKKDEIKNKLAELKLDTRGHKDVLKKRLKTYFKNRKLAEAKIKKKTKPRYDYYLVIDFEATCDTYNPEDFDHEIIEFPALLINAKTISVEDEFHAYVKPSVNQKLTEFCKKLTGITQQQVDSAETFSCVLEKMTKWMASHQLGTKKSFALVTDGPWDMSRFMYLQCQSSHIAMPDWSRRWVNLRKSFCNFYRVRRTKLITMLEILGLAFEGHQHSGLHDTRNIARIVLCMLEDGADLHPNEELFQDKRRKNHALISPLKREDLTDNEHEEEEEDTQEERDHVKTESNETIQNDACEKLQNERKEVRKCGRRENHLNCKGTSVQPDKVDHLSATMSDIAIDNNEEAEISDLLCYYALQKS